MEAIPGINKWYLEQAKAADVTCHGSDTENRPRKQTLLVMEVIPGIS